MKVTIREKKLSNGDNSLYLDLYYEKDGGMRRKRISTGLRLEKGNTPLTKARNKTILQQAELIKHEYYQKLITNKFDFLPKLEQNESLKLLDFFKDLTLKRIDSQGNYGNWDSCLKHLKKYDSKGITLKEVNRNFCIGFKEFLLKEPLKHENDKLSSSSSSSYFNKFKAALKEAYEGGLIEEYPLKGIKSIKPHNKQREFLTQEELQLLIETPIAYNPKLKSLFIFGCLTGLRFSDLIELRVNDIKYSKDNGYAIAFTQRKTKENLYHPISEEAVKFINLNLDQSEKLFKGIKYSAYNNKLLQYWVYEAGIQKRISFHCSRHTYATLCLNNGIDLHTVQKLLGHNELKTTMIYAKLMDVTKLREIKKFPKFNI